MRLQKQIIEILQNTDSIESATNDLLDLFYQNQKMQKKYFAWINEISLAINEDKKIIHYFLKNKFLSEVYQFQGKDFRHIRSFKDLSKSDFLDYMGKVSNYFLTKYKIDLQ